MLASLATPMLMGAAVSLPATAQAQSAPAAAGSVRGLPDFTDLVEQVGPSVVNIRTVERVRAGAGAGGGAMDEEMQEFFRRFFGIPLPGTPRQAPRPNTRPQQQPEQEVPRGVGSGFVISPDGYVMTNAHVVEGADEVIVTLTDKREFKARIVGSDTRTDVAVVKIEATGLPAVRIGDVNRLRVGEWVMAIGSPFGLENTVTAGIVSAKQRDTGNYLPFIQTDVAVNPGNSGGPLINLRGEVVGINSQIYSRSGGFMGISFAIPIDVAMNIKDQLVEHGRVQRGRLGIAIQGVDKDLAQSFGLAEAYGALVASVEPDSAAEKAGLQAGDVVLSVDGRRINDSAELPRVIGEKRPGTRVKMEVWRDGRSRSITATLDEMKTETLAIAGEVTPSQVERLNERLGLSARTLTAQEAAELSLRGGVIIESVDGPSARAGLQRGDVILAVNNQQVKNVTELRALLEGAGNRFAVLIQRGNARIFVPVRIE